MVFINIHCQRPKYKELDKSSSSKTFGSRTKIKFSTIQKSSSIGPEDKSLPYQGSIPIEDIVISWQVK